MRPSRLAARAASSQTSSSARDAVLVRTCVGVDAVAERLLVAEARGPATRPIHLKPVSVSACGCPRAAAILPEQRRGDDRGRRRRARVARGASRWCGRAARRPRRRAASASRRGVRARRPRSGRRRGRWRPRGRRRLARPAPSRGPSRPAPRGWGTRRSGSPGRARPARRRRAARRSRRRAKHLRDGRRRRRRAAACRRSSGRAGRPGRPPRRRVVEVGARRTSSPSASQPSPRGHVGERADARRSRRRSRRRRRHDLAAVAEVDLVAVVLRRVVAGGDHHAGDAAEVRGSRTRAPGWAAGAAARSAVQPGAGHHLAVSRGEDVGVVPGVVPDRRRRPPRVRRVARGTPRGRPPRGSPRRGSSGWARRRARRAGRRCRTPACPAKRSARSAAAAASPAATAAQTSSSSARVSGPGPRRPARRASRCARAAACRSRAARLLMAVPLRSSRTTAASRRPQRSAAARPASSTSSWDSGSPVMPAARLVTSEMPSTSAPACAGGDGLQRRGHADQVAAERPGHPDLGRRLVVRAGELHVDALVEVGSTSRASARSRGE